jgi:hypothetical protein
MHSSTWILNGVVEGIVSLARNLRLAGTPVNQIRYHRWE